MTSNERIAAGALSDALIVIAWAEAHGLQVVDADRITIREVMAAKQWWRECQEDLAKELEGDT